MVYECKHVGITTQIPPSMYVSVLIFPLAFSVNAAYQRREGALSHSAAFKAYCLSLYLHHRRWQFEEHVPHDFLACSCEKFTQLFASVRAYVTATSEYHKAYQLQVLSAAMELQF